jgi:protein O-GlcNAc transferase
VSALPAASNHFVTFAAFHRLFKLSPVLLEAYAGILHRVPRSHLVLHHAFGNGPRVGSKLKRRVEGTLSEHGISPKRLTWVGTLPYRESMALYQQVDLALDAYPCSGVTTTAEALYMGVPVVSWYDQQPRSRQSLAMLAAVGLEDLAVNSAAGFADRAVEWASDWTRLAKLRRVLRKRMRGSPLCDAEAFARSLEAAYRDLLHAATTECKERD